VQLSRTDTSARTLQASYISHPKFFAMTQSQTGDASSISRITIKSTCNNKQAVIGLEAPPRVGRAALEPEGPISYYPL
jgi:hypothetical protein